MKRIIKAGLIGCLVVVTALFAYLPAQAADSDYPRKPIRVIVPFAAGGGLDVTARATSHIAAKYLGQQLTIVNVTGGGGTIGTAEAMKSAPDGYTILYNGAGPIVTQPHINQVPYKIPDDFIPIALLQEFPVVLTVKADAPCNDLKGFVQWAQKEKLIYGNNMGSIPDLTMRAFMMKAGITFSANVSYTGDAPSYTALLGGHIHVTTSTAMSAANFLAANQVKVLGNTGVTPITVVGKTIPTFKEQGYDLVMTFWNGVFAPKGTPAPIVKKIEDAFQKACQDEEYNALATKLLFTATFKTGKEFTATWMRDYKSFGEIIRASTKK